MATPLSVRPAASTFNIQRMEEIYDQAHGAVDAPHGHDYYTVIWVQEGTGAHLVDFTSYPFAKDAVFFVSPRQVHQVMPAERPQGWVITFSPRFLQLNHINEDFITEMNLFGHFDERPPILLPTDLAAQSDTLLHFLRQTYESTLPYRLAAMSAYLKLFLIYCHGQCELPPPDMASDQSSHYLLRAFKKLVAEHFQTYHQVQDYAHQLHISAKHLNQVVKTLIGQTAKEVIQEKLILNAKRELRYSQLSIKEIGYNLGFNDPLYFSAFFKKCTGQSPSEFRG